MRKRLAFVVFVVSLFCMNFFVSATSVNIQDSKIKSSFIDDAELPIWSIGHYWKYNMDFIFTSRDGGSTTFSVDAEVTNMYATVTQIVDTGEDVIYVLSISGQVAGVVTLFDAGVEVAEFTGDLGGTANISKNTLAIKQFVFESYGEVNIPVIGWRNMHFLMTMGFVPGFDFFDFPINENEEPWNVQIEDASLYAYVNVDIPFGETSFNSSMYFSDVMCVNRTETITVPAGTYETFVLSGTWGFISQLWYAPVAGYLAKVDEALTWDNGSIESEFHLVLLDTNYDVDNLPPNPPAKPYGPSQGEVEQDYTYTTQTTDPNNDNVYYWFDWGDNTNSGWIGPFNSGATASATHRWYNKGVYIVIAKARDETGIESSWSEPLSVLIAGDAKVTVLMHRIEKKDEIDWSVVANPPEWFYMVAAISEGGTSSPPQSNHNTDDGTYNGNWIGSDIWEPNKEHNLTVTKRFVTINIKLMDHDDIWEGGSNDLADVSGCDYPDCDGYDDDTPDKRGAIYHGTYDVVTEELKLYDPDPDENADFVYSDQGYYLTCGDYAPDNSIEYENGMTDPQNDALVYFRLTNDYIPPQAVAQIMQTPDQIRPYVELQFAGIVGEGVPSYTWYWEFGDGSTSNVQNPTHIYTAKGTYTVKLTVKDGFEQVSTNSIAINVRNSDPILTNDHVEWTGRGSLRDTFTFSVYYMDTDLDVPTVMKVYIDEKENTLDGDGSNGEYSVKLKGSEIGFGKHSFYFYFEDGHGGSVETSKQTFKVKFSFSKSRVNLISDLLYRFPNLMKLLEILDSKLF
jgi:PKD repeat protein